MENTNNKDSRLVVSTLQALNVAEFNYKTDRQLTEQEQANMKKYCRHLGLGRINKAMLSNLINKNGMRIHEAHSNSGHRTLGQTAVSMFVGVFFEWCAKGYKWRLPEGVTFTVKFE